MAGKKKKKAAVKKQEVKQAPVTPVTPPAKETAIQLHQRLMKENGLDFTFDTIQGTVATEDGYVVLDEPKLALKVNYVNK